MTITESLLTPNEWSRPGLKLVGVRGLVAHWTADPRASALNIRNFFEGRRFGQGGYGSTHYVAGLAGEVIHMIPDDEMAYHVGSQTYTPYALAKFGTYPNNCTIGVEMCVRDAEGSYPPETWESAVELFADLCRRHSLDPFRDVVTHQTIVGWKVCPKWFRDHPEDLALFRYEIARAI